MKIAQKLIKIYPDCQLWQGVSVPPAMGSLSFFLTEEGKLTLRLASNSKILSEKIENKQTRSLHIQSEKVGEDRILPDKPKTLLEFLRKDYGKTKED